MDPGAGHLRLWTRVDGSESIELGKRRDIFSRQCAGQQVWISAADCCEKTGAGREEETTWLLCLQSTFAQESRVIFMKNDVATLTLPPSLMQSLAADWSVTEHFPRQMGLGLLPSFISDTIRTILPFYNTEKHTKKLVVQSGANYIPYVTSLSFRAWQRNPSKLYRFMTISPLIRAHL